MANNDAIEAKKAMDDIVDSFRQHNTVVAEGAAVLEKYSTVLIQLPTEAREMLTTFSALLTETKKQEAAINNTTAAAVKHHEKIRAELQKTLDAEKSAASKKEAQIKKAFADAEAARNKDMAAQQAKTDKEIALYEKQAQKQQEINAKKIQSDQARAEKEIEIENRKNAKIAEATAKMEARWSRTGANSVIPGMGNKISEIKETEKLASAYRQLSLQVAAASLKYQDLIVRGKLNTQTQREYNAELAKAKSEFTGLQSKILAADAAVDKWGRTGQRSVSILRDLVAAFGIQMGVQGIVNFTKAVFDEIREIQSLDLALRNVTGSQEEFYRQQVFLGGIAEKYGLQINEITRQYTQWYVSAKEKLGNGEIQQIFESIANAGANMGLSMEAQNNAFLALEQMMSKGTIQAEELKRQLGNALPGAFEIMVKTMQKLHPEMNITQRKLMDMVKAGKLMSAEILPEFAKQFEIAYGIEAREKVETLTAKTNRLATAWTNLVRSVNESDTGGLSSFFGFFINRANELLSVLIRINDSWATIGNKAEQRGRGAAQGMFDAAMVNYSGRNPLSAEEKTGIRNRVKEINEEIVKAQKEGLGLKAGILQAEKDSLIEKLFYSDPKNREAAVARIRTKAQEDYKYYAKEYNKIIEEAKKKASGMNFTDIGDDNRNDYIARYKNGEKEALRELMGQQSELVKLSYKVTEVKKQETVATAKTAAEIRAEEKARRELAKAVEDSIKLNLAKIKSEYDLQIAILERRKAEANDRASNEDSLLKDRLKARRDFSQISIEILDLELRKERAILLEKQTLDINDNNLALNNKKQSYAQWATNLKNINERTNNELEASDLRYSLKWNDLLNSDAAYYKKIEQEKRDFTDKTRDLVIASAKNSFEAVSNNEKLTLTARQKAFQAYVDLVKKELDLAKIKELGNAKSQEEIDFITHKYAELGRKIDELESPFKKAGDAAKTFFENLGLDKLKKMTASMGLSSLDTLFDFDKNGQSSFMKLMESIDTIEDKSERMKMKFVAVFETISSVVKDAFGIMSQASKQHFDEQRVHAQDERDNAILYAGESTAAKAEIERQYQRQLRDIRRREAKAQQEMAVFNIAINTAQAIMGLWVKPGFPAAIPMIALVSALGLAQIAMVKSKEIPGYFKGTRNAEEGYAWTQERGRELIFNNRGKLKSLGSDSGAELTKMDGGDQVLTNDESKAYMKLLGANNISPFSSTLTNPLLKGPVVKVESGGMSDAQVDRIVHTLEKGRSRTVWDKSGIRQWVSDGNTETERMNNRINGIGDSW